ncbi:MAG: 2-hydroxyacid dehydrogenase [Clostridia bacterium]|nr:2-hydroxyacid dehydrogenase [Clostridia bacterium]
MRIAFFDTKPYDHLFFDEELKAAGYEATWFEHKLTPDSAGLAAGHDAVCVFVNDQVDAAAIQSLQASGVRLIALRCAGYNNIDFKEAFRRIHVVRVPGYSPAAVAEHAAALLLTLNRKTHRAFARTRDFNFAINGLMGSDLSGKTAGIVGTGRIGQILVRILRGFDMRVIAYDPFPLADSDIEYVPLDRIWRESDVVSLHCPLTPENVHLVGHDAVAAMKPGVLLINTSRGGLIDTDALLEGLRTRRIGGAGLDVYEEEADFFFEDKSNDIFADERLALLLAYPNVLVTSHQGFFTREAMQAIARTTVANIQAFERGEFLENEICYQCMTGGCDRLKTRKNCF